MKLLKIFFSAALLLSVVGITLIGVFYVVTDTDMMLGMTDCPFMTHQETLCPMTTLDHINALQSVLVSIIPSSLTLLLAFLSGMILLAVGSIPGIQEKQKLRMQIYSIYIDRPDRCYRHVLQELFSRGVLHPKLF